VHNYNYTHTVVQTFSQANFTQRNTQVRGMRVQLREVWITNRSQTFNLALKRNSSVKTSAGDPHSQREK